MGRTPELYVIYLRFPVSLTAIMNRTKAPAPEISKDYQRLLPDAKLFDVGNAVRSDESTGRYVVHSLVNRLNYKTDVNSCAFREPGMNVKEQKSG